MNPILDQFLVGAIILIAATYMLFRAMRRGKRSCGSSCACDAKKLPLDRR
jgi:hypothetical protein